MADTPQILPPSIDPAHRQSIYGTVKFIIDKMVKQEMDGMMPARVIAVDRTKNRVTVEIMVGMLNTARQVVKRAQVSSVPIYQPSAGGYVINFPVQQGDLGWLKATDTDISLFLQSLSSTPAIQPPNTFIMHKFDSAMFFPDEMNRNVTIASEDADNLVIQNDDGTVRISISNAKVKVTAPLLEIDAPHTTMSGDLVVTGNVTGDGISLNSHQHTGVTTGPGNTGGPI